MRESLVFWLLVLRLGFFIIFMFAKAAGYKNETKWNASLTDRLTGILISIIWIIIIAIALGWILK